MIGRSGERGSGISVLAARHDDDDDDDDLEYCLSYAKYFFRINTHTHTHTHTHIYIYIYILRIAQSSSIAGASSDCLVLYPGHSLEESYPSAEMQSVYSTAPADWVSDRNIEIKVRIRFLLRCCSPAF